MSDAYILSIIGIVATIAQGIGWYWVNSVKNTATDNAKKYDELKTEFAEFKLAVSKDYQSKADAQRDMQNIMDVLREIKVEVKEVSHKLDKKADKP